MTDADRVSLGRGQKVPVTPANPFDNTLPKHKGLVGALFVPYEVSVLSDIDLEDIDAADKVVLLTLPQPLGVPLYGPFAKLELTSGSGVVYCSGKFDNILP